MTNLSEIFGTFFEQDNRIPPTTKNQRQSMWAKISKYETEAIEKRVKNRRKKDD